MAKESNKKEEKVTKSDVNKKSKKEEKVAKSDSNKKNKKSGFKDFKAELKKVVWPTPKELVNSTTAVIVIVLITAVIVFGLDVLFESLNTYGIDKIRTMVSESSNEEETVDESQEVVLDAEESDTTDKESDTTTDVETTDENTENNTTEKTEE